ncbi:MAG TPA: M20/M25/M40 family metallo-hydrolase [Longimicrobiales bacterium]
MTGYGSQRARSVRSARLLVPALAFAALGGLGATGAAAQGFGGGAAGPQERIDTVAIQRIKDEGFKRSQVMNMMSWLTDVHGPRLTGSPIARRAGDWTLAQFNSWGLSNAHYEWFEFGRGWVNDRMIAQVTSPVAFPVIGYPGAWTYGTDGMVKTDVVLVPNTVRTAADFAPYRGKLKGKIVISVPPRDITPQYNAPGHRYTQEELNALSNPYPPARGGNFGGRGGRGGQPAAQAAAPSSPLVSLPACFLQEGVAAVLSPGGGNSTGGNVFPGGNGNRALNAPRSTPAISLTPEHYGRIYRILEKGLPVKMDLEVRNTFYDDTKSFNIIGEIPGTDKADEIVMLGAHFDSWQSGTGATDNAAGSAVMMEAMRILKALNLPMRRTVRIALWTGEEQGLIGSREYVTEHFADRATMALKPEHSKFSAYYNVDNGTGAIRGIYLQGNDAVGPIFNQWMRYLTSDSITVDHIARGNTGGTDHQSFDAVGLPGFQFIQDPIEYSSRTHHSSQDLYERVQAMDMKHNAVAVAAFVYLTANRDDLLPRKPLPVVQAGGAGRGGFGGGQAAPTGCPAN